jgi:predicted porin
MKKSLLALATLCAFAGAANAQSSVTLFGLVDLSLNSVKNGANTTKTMDSNMLNSNRLGFRGVEDLGGGMSASFWLEGGMANDTGSPAGFNFQRRSTVSLSGSFGEIRLGRDYTNSFSTKATYDAYGANGMGTPLNMYAGTVAGLGSNAATRVRADNMVGYFLPGNLGGLYGSAQMAAGETATSGNKYKGFRLGYAAGPFDISGGFSTTETVTSQDFKTTNIGASYNMGFAKIMALYDQHKYGALKYTTTAISTSVPMGQGEFRASYSKGNAAGGTTGANDSNLFGLEYIYNLSKRTALYTQYGRLKNSGTAASTVGAGPANVAGGTSTGYGAGIRHMF